MEATNIVNSVAALMFVLCLIGLASLLLRRLNANLDGGGLQNSSKIKILESKKLDAKNKIVLLEKGHKEFLVLLSPDGNIKLGSERLSDAVESYKEKNDEKEIVSE